MCSRLCDLSEDASDKLEDVESLSLRMREQRAVVCVLFRLVEKRLCARWLPKGPRKNNFTFWDADASVMLVWLCCSSVIYLDIIHSTRLAIRAPFIRWGPKKCELILARTLSSNEA